MEKCYEKREKNLEHVLISFVSLIHVNLSRLEFENFLLTEVEFS